MKILFIGIGCAILLTIGFIFLAIIAIGFLIYRLGVKTEKEDRYWEPSSTDNIN